MWSTSSLPGSAKSIYTTGTDTTVALIPFGSGTIAFLAYDWFNAEPVGSQDGGWLQVLDSAVEEVSASNVNQPPTAVDDSGAGFTTDEDTAFTTASVLANDSDPEGDPLSIVNIDTGGTTGLVTDNGDGTFDYDPNGQFESLAIGESATDTFEYTIADSAVAAATTITFSESVQSTGSGGGFNGQTNRFLISADGEYRAEFFWLNTSGHDHINSGTPEAESNHNYARTFGLNQLQGVRITRTDGALFDLASMDLLDGEVAVGQLNDFNTGAGTFTLFDAVGTLSFGSQFEDVNEVYFVDPWAAGGSSTSNNWDNIRLETGGGSGTTDTATVTITINGVNDAPTIDAGGGVASDTFVVTVNNVAPAVGLSAVSPIDENDVAELTGSYTDPGTLDEHEVTVQWEDPNNATDSVFDVSAIADLTVGDTFTSTSGDGAVLEVTALTADTVDFRVEHQYLDDGVSGTPWPGANGTASDDSTIVVTVQDDDSGVGEADTTFTVSNVAPMITAFETDSPFCGGADENETVTATLEFTDPGVLDTHEVLIDWGDGNVDTIHLSGDRVINPTHVYATGGVFEVTVSVADDDQPNVLAEDSTTVVVSGVGVVGNTLYVVGTDGDDQVSINQTGNGTIKVHADFLQSSGPRNIPAAGVEQISVILCGGDDHATIAGNMTLPAIIDGGDGDDHLKAGRGGAVLLGGDGNDKLIGGSGNDIMIGGAGLDRLVGGPGEDFMAGGSSSYESDPATHTLADDQALLGFLQDWSSADSRAARESALDDLANSLTDDGDEDKLTGASGNDWFFADQEDLVTDLVANGNGNGGGN